MRPDWAPADFAQSFVDFVALYGPKLRENYALSLRDQWPALDERERPPRARGPWGTGARPGCRG